MTRPFLSIVAALLVATGSAVHAQAPESEKPMQLYAHAWLGAMDADESWTVEDPATDSQVTGDFSDMPLGGGAAQRVWGDRSQIGFEGGGIASWHNDEISFAGSNGSLLVDIDTELFLLDVFMGGVVAVKPTRWLRLYAAAGPAIAWGYVPSEDTDDGDSTVIVGGGGGGTVIIDLDASERDFSFALYGRVGLQIELDSGFTFGVSARYAEHEFDFGDRGELKLDEVQWFLTLGGRL